VRGACQTGIQRESCRCAGTHTKKKRRPDCPKRVDLLGVKDCLHREREMREIFRSERCQTHEGGAGEGDLFESAWRSTGTAQQYSRLPHKVQPQMTKKSGLEGGGAGDSKKKGLSILFLGQSTHRQKAEILSFPSRGRPPPTFHPITVFSSLGATKKNRVLQGTVVLHMQYPARVTNEYKSLRISPIPSPKQLGETHQTKQQAPSPHGPPSRQALWA